MHRLLRIQLILVAVGTSDGQSVSENTRLPMRCVHGYNTTFVVEI